MTKDELKQQYIKWAERCGVAEKLGSDLDRKADDALKNVTAHILDTTSEATIEKTTISSVLLSRFAIEWGEKSLDMNAAIFALCCSEILYQMQSEIDVLKEKLNTSTKFLKILHDEVADLADSCKNLPEPAGHVRGVCYCPARKRWNA